MNAGSETAQVVQALEKVMNERALPSQFSKAGKKLLSQLQTALQITFVGRGSSGKTSLINMMLGEETLPQVPFGRVIDLEFNATERTILEYYDGTVLEESGLSLNPERSEDIFRVRIGLPREHLRLQTYTEVRLLEGDAATDALLDFVAQSSTLTVWCSEIFDDNEQRLWSGFPDHVKDHGFLALTMADRQIMKGTLETHLNRLENYVSEEFFDVFPVAVLQALKARQDRSSAGQELWELSGGSHLFKAIHKLLALGREEDADRARLLLAEVTQMRPAEGEAVETQNLDLSPHKEAKPSEAEASQIFFGDALTTLTKSAEQMLREAEELAAFDCTHVLDTCLETVQKLRADLAHAQVVNDACADLVLDMQESENMLLLFTIEQDEEAAIDAVSLLIQMKKDFTHKLRI